MTNVSTRIKAVLCREGLTQRGLAERLNVTPQTVNNWITRDSISKDAAEQISAVLDYSLEWILKGMGMPKKDASEPITDKNQWNEILSWEKNRATENDEVAVHFLKDIEFACGDGTFRADDHNEVQLRLPKSTLRKAGANTDGSGVICFPVTGNSMAPIIPDGTIVAVDTNNKKIVDGKLYVINNGGLKIIKQLYRMPNNHLSIRSFNKDEFDDQDVPADEIEIIGKLFWYAVIL